MTGSLFSVLREGYGLDLDHGEEKASITTAAEEEGVPVEYCRTVARADKVELVSILHRGESEASDHA